MYTHADSESIKRAGNVFRDAVKLPPAEQKNIAFVGPFELEISRRNRGGFLKALTEYMGGNS
jgi:hypothetical protein